MGIEDAKKLAQDRATASTKETEDQARLLESLGEPQKGQKSAEPTSNADLTSYDEFLAGYKTCYVKTSSGKTFEVQGLSPGDFMALIGSPLAKALIGFGLDIENPLEALQKLDSLPTDQQVDLLIGDSFQAFAREVICTGVISLKFVDKDQRDCDKSAEEISVWLLPFQDLCEVFNAIIRLTASNEEIGMVNFFREEGEGEPAERDQNPSDSEGIPAETIGTTVSEKAES